ncbi:MAG: porin [Oceanospirillaceae bacterium]|nr:porin [Oceanospirillaceae bacterium]MBT10735.1 porin [Oceanospirillaceae bacterium]|tara:strand:+ start:53126 stop:54232 length:1107 start_codon:yes stop_codon:yes gene_type:complete
MRKTPLILLTAALPMAVQAANTEFSYGGYIKLDAMMSTYSDGDLGAASLGRDFYVPSTIPTSGGAGEETSSFDMTAKSSRFNLKSVTTLDNGETLTSYVEMDFLGSAQGNEVVSNSYSPRLRHAFFKYGDLTFGQTWSTFMNTGALAETVDFLGVSDGTVFNRQAQIRYTMGDFQFALENPETTVAGAGASDDGGIPDIVARYNMKAGDHAFTVAAIGRQFALQDGAGVDETATGFGVNVSGKVMVGADDLKFSYTTGNVARYVGLGQVSDVIVNGDGELEATTVDAAFVAFRHHWNSQLRSTIAYSMFDADLEDDTEQSSSSTRINLMYSPEKSVTYGVEYSMATIEKTDESEGDLDRLQFTAKYSF